MKQRIVACLIGLCLGVPGWAQTAPGYTNFGIVTTPPQVDATVFVNAGLFDLTGTLSGEGGSANNPATVTFDTENTLEYYNLESGQMLTTSTLGSTTYAFYSALLNFASSPPGFVFDFQTNGFHTAARIFENRGGINGQLVRVWATNLYNPGVISAMGGGLVKIDGQNVDLSRGGIEAEGVNAATSVTSSGITPLYYGLGTNNFMTREDPPGLNISQFASPNPVLSPMHEVQNPSYGMYYSMLGGTVYVPSSGIVTGFSAFAYTNQLSSTSTITQVIFVSTNTVDTNVHVTAGFSPSGRGASTAVVRWELPDVDIVTGEGITNFVYLYDRMASMSSNWLVSNYLSGTVYGPANYSINQGRDTVDWWGYIDYLYTGYQPQAIGGLLRTNTPYTGTLLVPPDAAGTYVTNLYAAWSVSVGSQSQSIYDPYSDIYALYYNYGLLGAPTDLNPALTDPTNSPGRVEIAADNLDLTQARLRAGSVMTLKAKHLAGNEGVRTDAPLVYWDLGSTNGLLTISNMVNGAVKRLSGSISVYSALWTNQILQVATADDGSMTTNSSDNVYSVTIVDHLFNGSQPMKLHSIALHATNVVVWDAVSVQKTVKLDAEGFTLNGSLTGTALDNFNSGNIGRVNFFTNNGVIVLGNGQFANDRLFPMTNFVNHNLIDTAGINVRARSIENDGLIRANNGSVTLSALLGKLDQGSIVAVGDITLNAEDLKVRQASMSGVKLSITATNRLSDGGPAESVSPLLTANDIPDPFTLAYMLSYTAYPPSAYLWNQIPAYYRDIFTNNYAPAETVQTYLVSELNRIIQANTIYTAQRFSGVTLSARTSALLATNPRGQDLVRLNRFLLEDAYMGAILRSPTSLNDWQCTGGFHLYRLPVEADLRGTRIVSTVPKFQTIRHDWAGRNLGATAEGFTNNAALGSLVLDGQSSLSRFDFFGSTTNNALYVDYLEFRNYATNYASTLKIDTNNFTIYFAAANLPVEELDKKFNGGLRWVRNYAGPLSSTNVTIGGNRVLTVNKSLLSSAAIDSDADGIANGLDTTPFEGAKVTGAVTNAPATGFTLTWTAAAQTVYAIDYTANLSTNLTGTVNWQYLMSQTNSATTNRVLTVKVPAQTNAPQQYYRIRYAP